MFDALGALVEKSLLVAEGQPTPRHRLLDSTRLYALEQLQAAAEEAAYRERHARCLAALLTVQREDRRRWRTPPAEPATLVAELDNARAALDWAKDCGDHALVADLAAGTSHVFLTASLIAEYLHRVFASCRWATRNVPKHWLVKPCRPCRSWALTRTWSAT